MAEILDRFKKMSLKDMEKSFGIYKAFLKFTENVKKEANVIPLHFGFVFKAPNYQLDPKLEKTLQSCISKKERGEEVDDDQYADFDLGEQDYKEYDNAYEERKQQFDGEEDDDEDSDDYGVDILADVKAAEEFATHSQPQRSGTMTQKIEEEKIHIDEYNTAALDDLLGGGEAPQRSATTVESQAPVQMDDPFADGNQFHDDQPPTDAFDMMNLGESQPVEPEPVEATSPSLEDLMGGSQEPAPTPEQVLEDNKIHSNPAITPEFEKLKEMYNTSAPQPVAPPANQPASNDFGFGGQPSGNVFNT